MIWAACTRGLVSGCPEESIAAMRSTNTTSPPVIAPHRQTTPTRPPRIWGTLPGVPNEGQPALPWHATCSLYALRGTLLHAPDEKGSPDGLPTSLSWLQRLVHTLERTD